MQTSRRSHKKRRFLIFLLILALLVGAIMLGTRLISNLNAKNSIKQLETSALPSYVDTQLIPIDGTSRQGRKLTTFNDIVVHYVANPQSTAQQNHDWFASGRANVSSHFIVGLEGEVIQCVPLDEVSSASNWRNDDTISIEVCHPDETGKFNDKSYNSLVNLCAWLVNTGHLKEDNMIRHYDITGKNCPKYFVEHPDAWAQFKKDVIATT